MAKDASKAQQDDRVNLDDFGSKEPKIEPDDLEGDAAILTVARVERTEFEQDGTAKKAVKLYFEETGDKVMFLTSKTDVGAVVQNLGESVSKWPGKRVPVEVVIRKFRGNDHHKVVPIPADDWEEALTPKRGKGGKR